MVKQKYLIGMQNPTLMKSYSPQAMPISELCRHRALHTFVILVRNLSTHQHTDPSLAEQPKTGMSLMTFLLFIGREHLGAVLSQTFKHQARASLALSCLVFSYRFFFFQMSAS